MSRVICLIEDDEIIGEALSERFEVEEMACDWFRDGQSALAAIESTKYCVIISDINLPDMNGEALFKYLLKRHAVLPPVLFITGYGSIDQAVRLLKMGGQDYLTKPFEVVELINKLRTLCPQLRRGAEAMKRLGVSPAMRGVDLALGRLAASASSVLITGETGVGKEYVARALHEDSEDAAGGKRPFIAVNCGAIPDHLQEAELFGHEKGAFTDAIRAKRGLFEQADGGTLFLDEVGDMPLAMQVKILRAIQERSIQRVGSEKSIRVDIRLIVATHRDLAQMVKDGEFREDLYYRINVVNLHIPPLRERKEDISWYAGVFLDEYRKKNGGQKISLNPGAESALLSYPWPGNIRELRNILERACVLSPSPVISAEYLFGESWQAEPDRIEEMSGETLAAYIEQCERAYIERVLAENMGRVGDTAGALGISRKTLWDKMRRLGLKDPK
ncbi:MAG: sigma-54-dependent Fis family transcriptional regulator [Hyphomicrobiales bacterium]|nr:MAG: sigma-54-dependent Fis family transcriptional regulator [Hyphomicrobiales bacterium]